MNKIFKNKDIGRLIIRLGIGVMFMYHGYPKIMGGIDKWESLGAKMEYMGIAFLPVFWGFMAALSEFVGGMLFLTGFKFRWACFFMAFTMAVAVAYHLGSGDGLGKASHAIELGVVFISMLFIGPGAYSIDRK